MVICYLSTCTSFIMKLTSSLLNVVVDGWLSIISVLDAWTPGCLTYFSTLYFKLGNL